MELDGLAGPGGDVCMGVGFNIRIACENIARCLGVGKEDDDGCDGRSPASVGTGTGVGGMGVAAEDIGVRATDDVGPRAIDDVRYAAEIGLIISQSLVWSVIQSRLILFPPAVPPCE